MFDRVLGVNWKLILSGFWCGKGALVIGNDPWVWDVVLVDLGMKV